MQDCLDNRSDKSYAEHEVLGGSSVHCPCVSKCAKANSEQTSGASTAYIYTRRGSNGFHKATHGGCLALHRYNAHFLRDMAAFTLISRSAVSEYCGQRSNRLCDEELSCEASFFEF
ncbi:hypothetical protein G7K_5916-t1 [Saitoella complicata NRRL Y-17804]|uniref:Uncharacterized protein n=1 Tax=Saitoella complicata (strain BCRC 22490 / CBS 7301 / JCM 7358 / NBRC 10748 / NRRL Y-17804) TaxID=698492 RepID=A0A0E9NQX4_SAICN|nr:hypothetical protein G7K_5916-t1 [Saitoella complicata NRRL Y-17804]